MAAKAEQTYTIPPLAWRKFGNRETGYYWTASDGWGDFSVYAPSYERYLARDGAPGPFPPRWTAHYDERGDSSGGTGRTIAEAKAAAEACHRERVASLLDPVVPPAKAVTRA